MTDTYLAFSEADRAWSAELARLFGRNAGDVRYTAQGKGAPGTRLRELHDAFDAARIAWEKARGIHVEPIPIYRTTGPNPVRFVGLRPVTDPTIFELCGNTLAPKNRRNPPLKR